MTKKSRLKTSKKKTNNKIGMFVPTGEKIVLMLAFLIPSTVGLVNQCDSDATFCKYYNFAFVAYAVSFYVIAALIIEFYKKARSDKK